MHAVRGSTQNLKRERTKPQNLKSRSTQESRSNPRCNSVLPRIKQLLSGCGLLPHGRIIRRDHLQLKSIGRSKSLRRGPKNSFKLTAEMRLAGELQLGCSGFIGVTLGNQFFCQTALQIPKPLTRRAIEVTPEKTLQLPLRNGTDRGHFCRIKIRLPSQLLPFLLQNSSMHKTSTGQFSSTSATAIPCGICSIYPLEKHPSRRDCAPSLIPRT
jgi:hypothetical protein